MTEVTERRVKTADLCCQEDAAVLEHPESDVALAGSNTALPAAFHTLLQTISDLMPLLPAGSSLQLTAVRSADSRTDSGQTPYSLGADTPNSTGYA